MEKLSQQSGPAQPCFVCFASLFVIISLSLGLNMFCVFARGFFVLSKDAFMIGYDL